MAVAGMTLGIIALLFGLIPVLGAFIAFPCAVVGLPLSAAAYRQGLQKSRGIGMAVVGLATSIIAMVVIVFWLIMRFGT